MGNLLLRDTTAYNWQQHFDIIEHNLHDQYLLLKSLKSGEEFIGKEIVSNSQAEIATIEQLISVKINSPSEHVTKLVWSATNKGVQYCTYQTKYHLLFEKYYLTLKEHKINRQFKCQSFSEIQVLEILQSMLKGLLYLKKIGQPHQRVCLQNIYIRDDKTVVLSDPWLFPKDYTSIFNFHINGFIYPSPQKILYENHMIQNYDLYVSDYYSLGVLLLQLLYMEQMDIIYEKGFRRILEDSIKAKIQMVELEGLKIKLKILLSYDPKERRKIEQFYGRLNTESEIAVINEKVVEMNPEPIRIKKQENKVENIELQIPQHNQTSKHLQVPHFPTHRRNTTPIIMRNQHTTHYPNESPSMNMPKVFFSYLHNQHIQSNNYQIVRPFQKIDRKEMVNIATNTSPHKNKPNQQSNQPNTQMRLQKKQKYSSHNTQTLIRPEPAIKQNSLNSSINNSQVNLTMVKNSVSDESQNNEIPFKKIQEINYLFKEVVSLNASEDRSERASEVIGHGFSTLYDMSSLNQITLKQQLQGRGSLPSHSRTVSLQKNTNRSSKSCANFEQIHSQSDARSSESIPQSIQSIPAQPKIQLPSVTPQRSYPIKKFNSTIKQVSEDQNSVSSYDNEYEERTVQYDVGTRYIGQIKNGKRNGRGLFYYNDGSYYEGYWKDNKMHGKGSLYYSNGSLAYDGSWYMDNFHGKGKIYNDCTSGVSFPFDFKILANQYIQQCWEVYQGDFFYQQKHGKGKLKFSNGEVYVGQFADDMVHGQGRFYRLNGEVISGKWSNGYLIDQL